MASQYLANSLLMFLSFSAGEGSTPCTSSILQEKQSELNLSPPSSPGVFPSPWMGPSSMGLGPPCSTQSPGGGRVFPTVPTGRIEGLGLLSAP